jgi:hypothetical protein
MKQKSSETGSLQKNRNYYKNTGGKKCIYIKLFDLMFSKNNTSNAHIIMPPSWLLLHLPTNPNPSFPQVLVNLLNNAMGTICKYVTVARVCYGCCGAYIQPCSAILKG